MRDRRRFGKRLRLSKMEQEIQKLGRWEVKISTRSKKGGRQRILNFKFSILNEKRNRSEKFESEQCKVNSER